MNKIIAIAIVTILSSPTVYAFDLGQGAGAGTGVLTQANVVNGTNESGTSYTHSEADVTTIAGSKADATVKFEPSSSASGHSDTRGEAYTYNVSNGVGATGEGTAAYLGGSQSTSGDLAFPKETRIVHDQDGVAGAGVQVSTSAGGVAHVDTNNWSKSVSGGNIDLSSASNADDDVDVDGGKFGTTAQAGSISTGDASAYAANAAGQVVNGVGTYLPPTGDTSGAQFGNADGGIGTFAIDGQVIAESPAEFYHIIARQPR